MSTNSALIADVRGSRDLDNWPKVFAAITRTLTQANKRFKADLVVKFHPTVGDEFQGVLARPEVAIEAYTFIKASLPVRLCFGLGVGEVEKSNPGETGLRGTAFYRARTALETCQNLKGLLRVQSGENRTDSIVNTILELTEIIEQSWTERQREVVGHFVTNPSLTHQQLADRLGIAQPTVTKMMKATRIHEIMAALKEAGTILQTK